MAFSVKYNQSSRTIPPVRRPIKPQKPTRAWNEWYHLTIHVHGPWLQGDPLAGGPES
jgi:hypothetical protein